MISRCVREQQYRTVAPVFLDGVALPQPPTEQRDDPGVAVGERNRSIPLRSFSCVERQSCHQQIPFA